MDGAAGTGALGGCAGVMPDCRQPGIERNGVFSSRQRLADFCRSGGVPGAVGRLAHAGVRPAERLLSAAGPIVCAAPVFSRPPSRPRQPGAGAELGHPAADSGAWPGD